MASRLPRLLVPHSYVLQMCPSCSPPWAPASELGPCLPAHFHLPPLHMDAYPWMHVSLSAVWPGAERPPPPLSRSAALLNTVVIGCVNVGSTLVSVLSGEQPPVACSSARTGSASLHTRRCCMLAATMRSIGSRPEFWAAALVPACRRPAEGLARPQSTSLAAASCSSRAASSAAWPWCAAPRACTDPLPLAQSCTGPRRSHTLSARPSCCPVHSSPVHRPTQCLQGWLMPC